MADAPVLSGAVIDDRHTYEAPGVEVDEICGWCPVQARGRVDGATFYFRARGSHWRLEIGELAKDKLGRELGLPDPVRWCCTAAYGEPYEAGWMSPDHTRRCLDAAFALYRATKTGHHVITEGVPTGPVKAIEERDV